MIVANVKGLKPGKPMFLFMCSLRQDPKLSNKYCGWDRHRLFCRPDSVQLALELKLKSAVLGAYSLPSGNEIDGQRTAGFAA